MCSHHCYPTFQLNTFHSLQYKSLGIPSFNRAYLQRALLDENVQYLLLALYWNFGASLFTTLLSFNVLTFCLPSILQPRSACIQPVGHCIAQPLTSDFLLYSSPMPGNLQCSYNIHIFIQFSTTTVPNPTHPHPIRYLLPLPHSHLRPFNAAQTSFVIS